jgi:hypothetical protein
VDALTAIQISGFARAITKSNHLVIAVLQIIHVFAFLLLLSSLVLMSLRLWGLVLQRQSIPQVTQGPTRLFWVGLTPRRLPLRCFGRRRAQVLIQTCHELIASKRFE